MHCDARRVPRVAAWGTGREDVDQWHQVRNPSMGKALVVLCDSTHVPHRQSDLRTES